MNPALKKLRALMEESSHGLEENMGSEYRGFIVYKRRGGKSSVANRGTDYKAVISWLNKRGNRKRGSAPIWIDLEDESVTYLLKGVDPIKEAVEELDENVYVQPHFEISYPLIIRLFELFLENEGDYIDDEELHFIVERMSELQGDKYLLTMDDYEYIVFGDEALD